MSMSGSSNEHEITEREIKSIIPMTPEEYDVRFAERDEDEIDEPGVTSDKEIEDMISSMQESARVPMNRTAPKNDWTENLRIAAGLK